VGAELGLSSARTKELAVRVLVFEGQTWDRPEVGDIFFVLIYNCVAVH